MKTFYKAGFSQVDITPDFQVELIGCSRKDNRSQGVLNPLYAQVFLLENKDNIFCLVSIDNIGLTMVGAKEIRQKIAEELKTDISHIMINFSHTHSAPEASSFALNGMLYFNFMCEKIMDCVIEANKNLNPCKIGWACTNTNIGDNRREGCEIVDNRLGALKIFDANTEKPIAIILRLTAHANVLMRYNCQISSDFFGLVREKIQDHFSCPVMLLQGAAGNIKPIGVDKILGGNYSDIEKIADIVELSTKSLNFDIQDIEDVQMVSKKITFFSDVPTKEEASKIAEEALATCGVDGTNWMKECDRLRNDGIFQQEQEVELQFLKINNCCFCGVAEEIFCELSIKVQEMTQNPMMFFNGYTNGCMPYLPTSDEWRKGGYETLYSFLTYYPYHGQVMPFREDTADKLVEVVVKGWNELTCNKSVWQDI